MMKLRYCFIKGFEPQTVRNQYPRLGLRYIHPSPSITPRQKLRLVSNPITLQVRDFLLTIPYFIKSLMIFSDLTPYLHALRSFKLGGCLRGWSDLRKVLSFSKWDLSLSRNSTWRWFSVAIQPSAIRKPIQYADSGVIVANESSLTWNRLEAFDLPRRSMPLCSRILRIVIGLTLKRVPISGLGIPSLYNLITLNISFLYLILINLFICQLYYSKLMIVKEEF